MYIVYIYISVIVREYILFFMINYHQASNKIDTQFYMEQLLKPENSLPTMGGGAPWSQSEGTGSNPVLRKLFSGFNIL